MVATPQWGVRVPYQGETSSSCSPYRHIRAIATSVPHCHMQFLVKRIERSSVPSIPVPVDTGIVIGHIRAGEGTSTSCRATSISATLFLGLINSIKACGSASYHVALVGVDCWYCNCESVSPTTLPPRSGRQSYISIHDSMRLWLKFSHVNAWRGLNRNCGHCGVIAYNERNDSDLLGC
jgi:hypothetical protein